MLLGISSAVEPAKESDHRIKTVSTQTWGRVLDYTLYADQSKLLKLFLVDSIERHPFMQFSSKRSDYQQNKQNKGCFGVRCTLRTFLII